MEKNKSGQYLAGTDDRRREAGHELRIAGCGALPLRCHTGPRRMAVWTDGDMLSLRLCLQPDEGLKQFARE